MEPLSGVVVVSLAVNLPGPIACGRLRDLGARVVKIEPPAGDPMATYSPAWYDELREGMEVRPTDLRTDEGRVALEALLSSADVLVTAQRPKALERLGLWHSVGQRYSRLVHVAIVGYPPPDDDHAGHDLTYQAAGGTLDPPSMPRVLGSDILGGERAATEALAGLALRDRTGRGGRRVVALSDAAALLAGAARHGLTTSGLLGGSRPGYALYESADGWVALAALEPHFWERACTELGEDHDTIAVRLRARTSDEWERWGAEHDIPIAAVRP